jgi:hypothetical protein
MRNARPGWKQGQVVAAYDTGRVTVRLTHSGTERQVYDPPAELRRVGQRVWIRTPDGGRFEIEER